MSKKSASLQDKCMVWLPQFGAHDPLSRRDWVAQLFLLRMHRPIRIIFPG